MLGPYRVLDLTDERCWFAGNLLAQLGADVVMAEPPGGWPRGFAHDAYNRGKRSLTAASADEMAALAATADIVLHNDATPFDVDLNTLRDANERLITVHITPWGETGPKADWSATDLTLFASSGQLAVTGDSDRPPVRISIPQAWLHASAQAAVAATVALEHRARTGRGQHVDLSTQQAVCETALSAILYAPAGLEEVQREAGGVRFGNLMLRTIYPCKDGYMIVTVAFGPMIGPMVQRFLAWMHSEGFCDDDMLNKDWVNFALLLQSGEESIGVIEQLMENIAAFCLTKTKAEMIERGLQDSLLVCPVNTLGDVLDSPQLAARDFWDEVDGLRHPGRFVLAEGTPLTPLGPAPEAGAHTAQVTDEWTGAESELSPTEALPDGAPADRPLAGLKVADLAWVAAAPLATKILAHWGATVVRVETQNRPCLLRGALGHRDDVPDQENAIAWHSTNANKKTISLDLSKPEARAVVRDLAAWADVVVESFTPGTMAAWGLGYEDLRELNPDLVMVSSCVMGQTGPFRDFAGFGNMAASVAGFFDITGWEDRGPAGPYLAYTDYCSPRFTVCALLAALDHRRRTGEGQHLDFSQMEAAVHLLAPAIAEMQATGEMRSRRGNADDEMVPHGVYPTMGDDEWIAIAVEGDEQWRSLAIEMRREDLADLDSAARRERQAELDEIVTEFTARQNGPGLTHRLQAHGIAAHHVQNSGACLNDPQLAHRGHFQWAPHGYARRTVVDAIPYTLSAAHNGFSWAGPTYGEHAMEILEDLLGYDADRIAELAVAEALE
ncbi:CoA transferase [Candidatus Poriferisodalis sp.]|uniref:CaiB/BaiF CoA-transferase family protein n=1 Tax=Candidatus Poriferisodalis sp. TaxID=3101277 RepID=UPI003B016988